MHVSVFACIYVCVSTISVSGVDLLELELQNVVTHCVGSGN